MAFAFAVEISQLCHAGWLDALRGTLPGRLVLGQGFLFSDLFCYTFGICLAALYMVWLLLDISDNIGELTSSDNVAGTVFVYYFTRLPAVLMLLLPYALLLSLLESLGKLSSNREVIAIIQAGRSVLRLCVPLMIGGALCTVLALGINYHWAPVAEGTEKEILDRASGKQSAKASRVLYRNLHTGRLWMVNRFSPDYHKGMALRGVEVTKLRIGGDGL